MFPSDSVSILTLAALITTSPVSETLPPSVSTFASSVIRFAVTVRLLAPMLRSTIPSKLTVSSVPVWVMVMSKLASLPLRAPMLIVSAPPPVRVIVSEVVGALKVSDSPASAESIVSVPLPLSVREIVSLIALSKSRIRLLELPSTTGSRPVYSMSCPPTVTEPSLLVSNSAVTSVVVDVPAMISVSLPLAPPS